MQGRGKVLMISNEHVFVDENQRMTILMNKRKGDGSVDLGNVHPVVFKGFANRYYRHPDNNVDLACVDVTNRLHPSSESASPYFFKTLDNKFLVSIDHEKVLLGSNVLFVGYPQGGYDTHNNLPLFRRGSLASLPNIDFRGRGEVLIDSEAYPGASGSPVFTVWDNKYRLLGVLTRSVSDSEVLEGRKIVVKVKEYMGLGVVIKQRHVQELIDHVLKRIRGK